MLSTLREHKRTVLILIGGILLGAFLTLTVVFGFSEEITGIQAAKKKSVEGARNLTEEVRSDISTQRLGVESSKEFQKPASSVLPDQMLVIGRNITLKVSSVHKVVQRIEKLAKENGGYVVSMSFGANGGVPVPQSGQEGEVKYSKTDDVREGNITVRVPIARYSSFVEAAKKEGELVNESEVASDITREYIDLNARLRNLQREETRLLQIFDSAKTVKDMILVENELRRIREEIESLTAQKKHLEESSSYALISFNLQKALPLVEPGKEGWGFDAAFRQAVRYFVSILKGAIVALGIIFPLVLLATCGYLLHTGAKSLLRVIFSRAGS